MMKLYGMIDVEGEMDVMYTQFYLVILKQCVEEEKRHENLFD